MSPGWRTNQKTRLSWKPAASRSETATSRCCPRARKSQSKASELKRGWKAQMIKATRSRSSRGSNNARAKVATETLNPSKSLANRTLVVTPRRPVARAVSNHPIVRRPRSPSGTRTRLIAIARLRIPNEEGPRRLAKSTPTKALAALRVSPPTATKTKSRRHAAASSRKEPGPLERIHVSGASLKAQACLDEGILSSPSFGRSRSHSVVPIEKQAPREQKTSKHWLEFED